MRFCIIIRRKGSRLTQDISDLMHPVATIKIIIKIITSDVTRDIILIPIYPKAIALYKYTRQTVVYE